MDDQNKETDSAEIISLVSLPDELLERILMDDGLTIVDLKHCALTCAKMHAVCQSNNLWKVKFLQKYPFLASTFCKSTSYCWPDEWKSRIEWGRAAYEKAAGMSKWYYFQEEVSEDDFTEFQDVIRQNEHGAAYLLDAMDRFTKESGDMTLQYYGAKLMRYIAQLVIEEKWLPLLELPVAEQSLELGATLMAQWFQPTEVGDLEMQVSSSLDDITAKVYLEVAKHDRDHPVLANGKPMKIQDVQSTLWTPEQARVILKHVNSVLYSQLGFHQPGEYYVQENSCIDKVLIKKCGIPITMSIVYASIARRLGVVCECVNFPSHFLLRWLEHPSLSGVEQYTFIDAYHNGQFLNQHDCRQMIFHSFQATDEMYKAVEPKYVFARMIRNFINIGQQHTSISDSFGVLYSALKLYVFTCPEDFNMQLLMIKLCLNLGINLSMVRRIYDQNVTVNPIMVTVGDKLREAEEKAKNKKLPEIKPKLRSDKKNKKVGWAVGMIMHHKRYDYYCVIYGWDPRCEANIEWIIQMGVNNLPHKHMQPFHNVLVEDGSQRYAAHESLEIADTPKAITHPRVGKYFKSFAGTHYVPNTETATRYPEDMPVTLKYVQEKYGDSMHT